MADELELPRGVSVSRCEAAPPWRADLGDRLHPSIHLVVRGSFYLSQGDHRAFSLGPGDLVLLVPGAEPSDTTIHCVEPAELISAAYEGACDPALAAAGPVLCLSAAEIARARGLAAIVGLLSAALAEPSASNDRLARSLLAPLLAYALHGRPESAAPADARIARALVVMESKPAARWTVASLARAAGMSRAAFARRFVEELGVPPLQRLAEIRMERAAQRLAESDDTLATIAAEIGYASEFAFSRAFKRLAGEAPGVYRRRARIGDGAFRAPAFRAPSVRAAA